MTRIARTRTAPMALALLLLVAAGCGNGAPPVDSSTAEGTVTGKVTIRGKPAAKGTISFDPSNIKRKDAAARSSPIGDDGSYTIKTLVGTNQVTFLGAPFAKDPVLQDARFQFEVKQGDNTFNAELPPANNP